MEHTSRFCLNLHAAYGCRHSGACCTAGWTIPIERPAFERVRRHLGDARSARAFTTGGELPDGAAAVVRIAGDGGCVFFESDRGRLCAIHRELGRDALPSACRQFPRVVVQDARSMRISCSHFCPSAAALLRSTSTLAIVAAPSNVDLGGALDGLDARGALPPLLHPRMLMDVDTYGDWEARAIGVLARDDLNVSQAIATIAAATRALEGWDGPSSRTSLADAVTRAFDREPVRDTDDEDEEADRRRVELARSSVPHALQPRSVAHDVSSNRTSQRVMEEFDRVVRNYVAARLFGNWIAYHGRGLQAIVEYLRVCRAVLQMEVNRHSACCSELAPWESVVEPAVRNSDLLLVHLSDAKDLAHRLSLNLR
jgi:Fe-S-cluster containining protein